MQGIKDRGHREPWSLVARVHTMQDLLWFDFEQCQHAFECLREDVMATEIIVDRVAMHAEGTCHGVDGAEAALLHTPLQCLGIDDVHEYTLY